MQDVSIKTFADLQQEVVQAGLCGKCGGCVSFCSAGQLHALEPDEQGFPRYSDESRCLKCGICYLICPVTSDLEAELQQKFARELPAGARMVITSARSTDPEVRQVATDGGVVTALLLYMLDRRLIDGAIVSRRTGLFSRVPLIATTREEIIAAAGSHFSGSSHLERLGEQYTTYTPTISAVRGLAGNRLSRVALVGTPCQVNTIRKMQCLSILPADVITYTLGLFCWENFAFTAETLQDRLGVDLDDIAKINIKDELIVVLNSGRTLHVPLAQVDDLARPACLACGEFANDYADLSFGGLGSPQGYTTVLIRAPKGQRLYTEALRQGYIEELAFSDASQMRSEKTKMMAKVVAFTQRKRERGRARKAELAAAAAGDGQGGSSG